MCKLFLTMLHMKGAASIGAKIDIQAPRVAAMTVVIGVHSLLAMAMLAIGNPVDQRVMVDGGASAISVSFVPRVAPSYPAPPPPPPPVAESVVEVVEKPVEVVQPVPVDVATVIQEAQPAIHEYQADNEDDGSLPIRTYEPAVVAEASSPTVFDADEQLPGEFMSQVDVMPMELIEFRKTSSPVYLDEAKAAGEQGIVVLKVLVDELGFPVGIQIVKSTAGEALARETVRAVSEWQFKPAQRNGIAVKGALMVPVYFFLDGLPPALRHWKSMGGRSRSAT